ncbi:MAG: oxygenase MpaB family protein [Saprospiraceae bacterium]|nr:oxygenase MpaB family protein [Saprospiraceae bacterium]
MAFTSDYLRSFRTLTDPVADQVISSLNEEGVLKINELFEKLTRNRGIENVEFSPLVDKYFREQSEIPDWVDHDKLKIGQDVYADYAGEVSMLLFFLSLPAAYTGWRGATVLACTGRLVQDPDAIEEKESDQSSFDRLKRRLMETAQFVVDVMGPDAYGDRGDAVVACLKVRLMHASIRHMIKKYLDWDVKELGEPINQEDMAGTLQSFSSLIIQGLENMGIELSEKERDGFYYSWHVTGHFMGVTPLLNPDDYETGLALGHAIINDQRGEHDKHESTNVLTKALVEYVNEMIPGKIFDNYLPVFVIKYYLKTNTHSSINFHHKPNLKYYDYEVILKLVSFWAMLQKGLHRIFLGNKFDQIKHHTLLAMLKHENNHKNIEFYIPPSLKENWITTVKGNIKGVTLDD